MHRDAWETIINYFGSTPIFQGPREGCEVYDGSGEPIWSISITIPAFALENEKRDHCVRSPSEPFHPTFTTQEQSQRDTKGTDQYIQAVYTSICMTGDKFGEFWTCSIWGIPDPGNLSGVRKFEDQKNENNGDNGKYGKGENDLMDEFHGGEETDYKVDKVLHEYKYDRISARNLVFIIRLTLVCSTIAERYERILAALDTFMDLKVCILHLIRGFDGRSHILLLCSEE